MKFCDWYANKIKEDGLRTALGIYPPAYGVGQYPPLFFTPMSGSAAFSLIKIHHAKDDSKKKSKKKGKKKKK